MTRNGKCTRPKAPLKDIHLPALQRQVVALPQSEPCEEDHVKKRRGNSTGPKAFLKDMQLPPLQRQKGTSPITCTAFRRR